MAAEGDFYQNLRKKIRDWVEREGGGTRWAEYVLLAPDLLHLLCKLSVDPAVPVAQKAKLAVAIAYFVSPIDLIPEALLGAVGYVDDVAFAAYVLNSIISTDAALVQKHWAGDGDVLDVVRRVLKVADQMVGSGLWKRLTRLAE